MKIVLVCGGRNYANKLHVNAVLHLYKPDLVVQGAAQGADLLAKRWAEREGVPCLNWPANWDAHGKGAGMRRNAQMGDFMLGLKQAGHATKVIAFPGGPGTANMIKTATQLGLDVVQVEDEGGFD